MLEESWNLVVNHVVKLLSPTLLAKVLLLFFLGASTVRRLELEAFPVETGSDVGKLPPFLGTATMFSELMSHWIIGQKRHVPNRENMFYGKTHWGDKLWPSFPRDASFPSCFDDRRGYKADLTSAASVCRESRRVTGHPWAKKYHSATRTPTSTNGRQFPIEGYSFATKLCLENRWCV